MMSVFLYLFAVATVIVTAGVAAISWSARMRADRGFREELAHRGLRISSMTFAENLELRSSDGIVVRRLVPLALGSATPLAAPELQRCSVVEMPFPAADLVVCRLGIAQAVFGPFLPPRIVTGDAAFDAEFGVFEPPSGPGRGSSPPGSRSWSTPDVLAALRASGFIAMQITGAQARIATDEKRGRAPNAPLVHQLDVVDLARRLRAAVADPPALPPALPSGLVPSPRTSPAEVFISVVAIPALLMLVWLTPGTFGLGFLACPDGGVFEHIVRPPHDVCRVSPTVTRSQDLGTLTAVVGSLAFAAAALHNTRTFFRQRAYLVRLAKTEAGGVENPAILTS